MQEVFEKIKERLERERDIHRRAYDVAIQTHERVGYASYARACDEAIEIVNQVAEEYKNESVKGDLISRSALIEKFDTDFAEGLIDCFDDVIGIVEEAPTAYNDGWIPCSERLPELTEGTECFKQSPCCLTTLKWWDGDMTESIGWYNQSGVWNEDSKNCKVVTWMPLPPKYQPKGE